jgi:hypothetical protein
MSAQDTVLLLAALAGWFLAGGASAAAVLVWHFATRAMKHQRLPTEHSAEEIDVEDLLSDISARLPKITDELNAALAEARADASAIGEPAERMLARLTEKIEQERDQWGQNVAEAYAAGMQVESEYWTDEEEEDPPF